MLEQLTDTENRACWLLASGKSFSEIANTLHFSYPYVLEVIRDVRLKLNLPHRNALIIYLLRSGYGDDLSASNA